MKVFAIAALLGLAFSLALLPITLGEADRYKVQIEEKGTRFLEEIDIDEEKDVEVFRVPAHNNVDGADFYHDFKMRVTIARIVSRKVCYISEMDSSLSSPGKLKEDLGRAASQPTNLLPVTTKSNLILVTGPANRLFLKKEALDFCGMFPIYNVETIDKQSLINETVGSMLGHRVARSVVRTYMSCQKEDTMSFVKHCQFAKWDLKCRMKSHNCYYLVRCENKQPTVDVWECTQKHYRNDYPVCCDLICPP